jgi:hypothetical protein
LFTAVRAISDLPFPPHVQVGHGHKQPASRAEHAPELFEDVARTFLEVFEDSPTSDRIEGAVIEWKLADVAVPPIAMWKGCPQTSYGRRTDIEAG